MSLQRWKTLLAATLVFAFAGAAAAQTATPQAAAQPPRAGGAEAGSKLPTPATVVADAPNARLAALIRRDLTIVRNKNVTSVSRIATGIYCILPAPAAGIVINKQIVILTPEYYFSQLNEIKVQYAAGGSGCPSNTIAVYTLASPNRNGVYVFSNAVSFEIIVP